MGVLIGNVDSGHFVIKQDGRVTWYGDIGEGEIKENDGVHEGMWMQGGETIELPAGNSPFEEARELFRREVVKMLSVLWHSTVLDPEANMENRLHCAAFLEVRLASSDAEMLKDLFLSLPIYEGLDLSIEVDGEYGAILKELREKPVTPVPAE